MDARSDKFLVRPVDDGLLGQHVLEETLRDAVKPSFFPPVRSRKLFSRGMAQFVGSFAYAGPTGCYPGECGFSCNHQVLLPTFGHF